MPQLPEPHKKGIAGGKIIDYAREYESQHCKPTISQAQHVESPRQNWQGNLRSSCPDASNVLKKKEKGISNTVSTSFDARIPKEY